MDMRASSSSWREAGILYISRFAVAIAILLAWESMGWFGDAAWTSQPSAIAIRLWSWIGGDLWLHIGTTLLEMAVGLAIGVPLGVVAGLSLGRAPLLGKILRPIISALYNTPMITVAPLLILWFGLGLAPKIYLVALVTFFLLFFGTFSGAQSIDKDLVHTFQLLGATRREIFQKLVLPASTAWIMSALKIALPFALIDAITGEMLAARQGLGFLLTSAVSQIDMTGVYAVLVVLMIIGIIVVAIAANLERLLLRWRES